MASVLHERHVSRRQLARNRWVWRSLGGMCAYMTAVTAALAFLVGDGPSLQLEVMSLIFAGLTTEVLLSEPPAIGTARNHRMVALPYVAAAAIFWASQTGGGAAVSAAIFIGPLAAVRLVSRQHMVTHLLAATILFALVAAFGGVDASSRLCMLMTSLAMWTLAFSCWVVLESAEAQGDELERLVRRDPLTGIGNLRLLRERLAEELSRHERINKPLTVLALDLNGFKALNDTLGHAAGDSLLRSVAVHITEVIRPEDTLVRQGGDEFCILLPETTPDLAIRTMNAVRAAVASVGVEGVSTGVGMASFPIDAIEGDVLLHVADERLRRDKGHDPDPERVAEPDRAKNPPGKRSGGSSAAA